MRFGEQERLFKSEHHGERKASPLPYRGSVVRFVYGSGDCSLLILPTTLPRLAPLRQDAKKPCARHGRIYNMATSPPQS